MKLAFLVLLAVPGQDKLSDAKKKAADAAQAVADLRLVAQKLLISLEQTQEQLDAESKKLESARAEVSKLERETAAVILGELRALLANGNGKPVKQKQRADPKGIYGNGAAVPVKSAKQLAQEKVGAPLEFDAPKGSPKQVGTHVSEDDRTLIWWTYTERPNQYWLYQGDVLLGAWSISQARYRAAVNGTLVGEYAAKAPVAVPKVQMAKE